MYGPPRRCKRKMTRTGWSAQKPVARRNLAFRIEPHYVKDCLAKIYAECVNLHGTPPVYIAYISVREKRRTMPLVIHVTCDESQLDK
jgi:hypothetical protein